ncbi:MAG: 2Fe-2S iron-sulfur cluster-binding protein [Burkholderiaceae bacterium]
MSTTPTSSVTTAVELRVNGKTHPLELDPAMPLVFALRDHLQLTGTKYTCLQGACGACTVWFDGAPVRACQLPVRDALGHEITTIEGLAGADADALRRAWLEGNVPQCGWCQSAQLMNAAAMLAQWRREPPSAETMRATLGAVACRCGTGQRVLDAVGRVLGLAVVSARTTMAPRT